jgi:hypothetical protein
MTVDMPLTVKDFSWLKWLVNPVNNLKKSLLGEGTSYRTIPKLDAPVHSSEPEASLNKYLGAMCLHSQRPL